MMRRGRPMQPPPEDVQLIGNVLALRWPDGREDYIPFELLRALSPSAENIGETDILGNRYGGDGPKDFTGVEVTGWDYVGGYAIRFTFSDGHRTGLYSYRLLREIGERSRD